MTKTFKTFFAEHSDYIKSQIGIFFTFNAKWQLGYVNQMERAMLHPVCKKVFEIAGDDFSDKDIKTAIRICLMHKFRCFS